MCEESEKENKVCVIGAVRMSKGVKQITEAALFVHSAGSGFFRQNHFLIMDKLDHHTFCFTLQIKDCG